MSTKIYEAYRFKNYRLLEFMQKVKPLHIQLAFEKTETLLHLIDVERILSNDPKAEKQLRSIINMITNYEHMDQEKKELKIKWEVLLYLYKKHYDNITNSLFNIQSGWTVFPDNKNVYVWPWGAHAPKVSDVLKIGDWIEDYSFWDNTDRPDNIDGRKWWTRGRKWDELHHRGEYFRLTYTVIDFSPLSYSTQFILEDMIFAEQGIQESTMV